MGNSTDDVNLREWVERDKDRQREEGCGGCHGASVDKGGCPCRDGHCGAEADAGVIDRVPLIVD
ncbi:MAG TPA: hypothetical protein DEB31_11465 [Clostridiales bacterium]|nr:hypothetical protein [Clostridiales bacterium]